MSGPHTVALSQLALLDTLDQERLMLLDEQRAHPVAVSRLAGAHETARARLAEIVARRTELARRIREGERELDEVQRRRERARARIASLTSEAQVAATEREIAQLGELISAQQDAEFELMVAAEETARDEVAGEREEGDAGAALEAASRVWAARAPILAARLAELLAAIDALTPEIPTEAMRAYRVGFENRANTQHRGATRTDGIMCVHCRTEIPVLWVNQARSGDRIHKCDGCKRVILGKVPDASPEVPAE